LPRPIQPDLPLWITASESEDTFIRAGATGANVLTALLGMSLATLKERIIAYRRAFAQHHPQRKGKVTLMLHTFVHEDPAAVTRIGVQALREYLQVHLQFAATRAEYKGVSAAADDDRAALVEHAVARYIKGASLIGTPEVCSKTAEEIFAAGVDEIACLIDFGVPRADAIRSLYELERVQALLGRGTRQDARIPTRESQAEIRLS
jgi:natural product biosynthesis luciferase-like monooxygenase protein